MAFLLTVTLASSRGFVALDWTQEEEFLWLPGFETHPGTLPFCFKALIDPLSLGSGLVSFHASEEVAGGMERRFQETLGPQGTT